MKVDKEIWELFKNGKVVINCRTEDEAKQLLTYCDGLGIKWCGGDTLIDDLEWGHYTDNTCYSLEDNEISYCDVDYAKTKEEIIKTFQELITISVKEAEKQCSMLVNYKYNNYREIYTLTKNGSTKGFNQDDITHINERLTSNIGSITLPIENGQVYLKLDSIVSIAFKLQ